MMDFETLTLTPIDRALIDTESIEQEHERDWLTPVMRVCGIRCRPC